MLLCLFNGERSVIRGYKQGLALKTMDPAMNRKCTAKTIQHFNQNTTGEKSNQPENPA